MPRFDGSGPMGYGPMTGRGFGPCGRGFRRGYGRGFYPRAPTKAEEKRFLEDEKKALQEDLKQIDAKLRELK